MHTSGVAPRVACAAGTSPPPRTPGTALPVRTRTLLTDSGSLFFENPIQSSEGRLRVKKFMGLVLVAVLALPAVGWAQGTEEKRYQIPFENSPSTGPADAPVTMFEFLDFQ
jgi:hypothetical protein